MLRLINHPKTGEKVLCLYCDVCGKPANKNAIVSWNDNREFNIACQGDCASSLTISYPASWPINQFGIMLGGQMMQLKPFYNLQDRNMAQEV